MSAVDETLFETMLRVENKDIFVDLKRNKGGVYLKISERNGTGRNTVLIPATGIPRLKAVLDEVTSTATAVKPVSRERKSRVAGNPDVVARSLYVSGLTWDTTDEELLQHFAPAGGVVSAVVLRQRRGGSVRSSLGCGIVEFSSEDLAINANNMMNDTELKGRKIHCREDRLPSDEEEVVAPRAPAAASAAPAAAGGAGAAARAPRPKRVIPVRPPVEDRVAEPNKAFVTGLTWDITNEELASTFSAAGRVVTTELLTTKKGRAMGSAIVEFDSQAAVTAAIAHFHGQDVKGRKVGVRQYFQ